MYMHMYTQYILTNTRTKRFLILTGSQFRDYLWQRIAKSPYDYAFSEIYNLTPEQAVALFRDRFLDSEETLITREVIPNHAPTHNV